MLAADGGELGQNSPYQQRSTNNLNKFNSHMSLTYVIMMINFHRTFNNLNKALNNFHNSKVKI